MRAFAYQRAASVRDALARGAQPETQYLAGGTELLNWMRLGIAEPARVVDIGRLGGELAGVTRLPNGGLRVGALTTLNDAAQHPDVARDYPVLSQAILRSASAQLRNLATVGGNPLQRTRCPYFRQDDGGAEGGAPVPCNKRAPGSGCSALAGYNDKHAIFGWTEACVATHPADPPVALAALDAVVVTEHPDGGRRIPVADLVVLPTRERPDVDTVLRPGELIVAYELGAPAPRSAYLKVRERESYEYATVSCAATVELDGDRVRRARVALGSVAHRPWRLPETERRLTGVTLGSAEARAAVEAGFADARPLSMNAYKIPLAKNAVARALEMAGRPA